jgi:hypothetical protein
MLQLYWCKSRAGSWLPLATVDLTRETDFGVYVIWHAGQPSRVVRVGQGDIASRLTAHRKDALIMRYSAHGDLYVTWAVVSPKLVDGVERYLAERWKPLVGDRFPLAVPLAVNSPFAA